MSLADIASNSKHRGILALEVLGASGGIAYLNHSLGAGELKIGTAVDGSGGVPLDGALGILGIGFAFFRPESRWAKHAMGLGLGFGAGFAYRTGAVMGDATASTSHATAGIVGTSRPAPQLAAHFAPFANPQTRRPVAVSR